MEKNSSEEANIAAAIEVGKLGEYLIGETEGAGRWSRPEEDYARWNALEHYYKALPSSSPDRQKIEETILAMIQAEDYLSVGAGATLARLLNLQSSAHAFEQMITSGVYPSLPRHTQDLILDNLARLQMEPLKQLLLEEVLEKHLLLPYLISWSSSPPHYGKVTQDDLWRMTVLAEYYEQEAKPEIQSEIRSQLSAEHPRWDKLEKIANKFLDQSRDRYPQFSSFLRECVGEHKGV